MLDGTYSEHANEWQRIMYRLAYITREEATPALIREASELYTRLRWLYRQILSHHFPSGGVVEALQDELESVWSWRHRSWPGRGGRGGGLNGDVLPFVDRRGVERVRAHTAWVHRPDGTSRQVTNLGWLLRNWKLVEEFDLFAYPNGTGRLIAWLRDGGAYENDWASWQMMLSWLKRPVFKGTPALLNGRSIGKVP